MKKAHMFGKLFVGGVRHAPVIAWLSHFIRASFMCKVICIKLSMCFPSFPYPNNK